MLNYMRAEFYKVFHRRIYLLGFLGFLLLGEAVILFSIFQSNRWDGGAHNTYSSVIGIMVMVLQLGLYCACLIADMVFSDQYKYNTLKNEISYGISRMKVYFSKLAVAAVLSVLLMAVVLGLYLGVGRLVAPLVPEDAAAVSSMGIALLTALPLWLGALSVSMTAYFTLRSNTGAAFAAIGVIAVVPAALKFLYLLTDNGIYIQLQRLCLTAPFDHMNATWAECGTAWLIGLGWIAVSSAVGAVLFARREIN